MKGLVSDCLLTILSPTIFGLPHEYMFWRFWKSQHIGRHLTKENTRQKNFGCPVLSRQQFARFDVQYLDQNFMYWTLTQVKIPLVNALRSKDKDSIHRVSQHVTYNPKPNACYIFYIKTHTSTFIIVYLLNIFLIQITTWNDQENV